MRKDFATLLKSKDPICLGVLPLLVDQTLLAKAARIADNDGAIQRIEIADGIKCYAVKCGSSNGVEYVVVPRKYCTCYYYNDSVLTKRVSWCCKHDLAVQLRLALAGPESIIAHPSGEKLIREKLAYVVTCQGILYVNIKQ
jgi:predicted nucleic acid-binding Zn finger protein